MHRSIRLCVAMAWSAIALAAAVDVGKPAVTYIAVLPSEPPARIAIVVEGNTFLAYACGKTDDFNSANSAWFHGAISNGVLDASVMEKLSGRPWRPTHSAARREPAKSGRGISRRSRSPAPLSRGCTGPKPS